MIPYGRQHITEADIEAVKEVLLSDFLTQGPAVSHFEGVVKLYCGAEYAVAVNSATSALHLACLALGLTSGDWLWTSPNTFVATANVALYCGANVDFVDVDPHYHNMSVDALKTKLKSAEKNGCLPKIVVPVHFAGEPCDMRAIHELAQRYGFKIIEDASHAIGARYWNPPTDSTVLRDKDDLLTKESANFQVGSCCYSDITVFSFHPVKIITTGEGGMALTNSPELSLCIEQLRSHAVTRDPEFMTCEPHGDWYYQQIDLGYNYRMTDLQAALGFSQMQRLDQYVSTRHELALRYDELLKDLLLERPRRDSRKRSALHLYPIELDDSETRSSVFKSLRKANIGVNVHYIPVHTQPYYQNLGFRYGDFPNSEFYYQRAISLPLYPLLTQAQQGRVVEELELALSASN